MFGFLYIFFMFSMQRDSSADPKIPLKLVLFSSIIRRVLLQSGINQWHRFAAGCSLFKGRVRRERRGVENRLN